MFKIVVLFTRYTILISDQGHWGNWSLSWGHWIWGGDTSPSAIIHTFTHNGNLVGVNQRSWIWARTDSNQSRTERRPWSCKVATIWFIFYMGLIYTYISPRQKPWGWKHLHSTVRLINTKQVKCKTYKILAWTI